MPKCIKLKKIPNASILFFAFISTSNAVPSLEETEKYLSEQLAGRFTTEIQVSCKNISEVSYFHEKYLKFSFPPRKVKYTISDEDELWVKCISRKCMTYYNSDGIIVERSDDNILLVQDPIIPSVLRALNHHQDLCGGPDSSVPRF